VFHPRLFIMLGLCVGLCACQPTNLAAFIPSAQPAQSSTSEQVTLTTIASFQGSDGNFYGTATGREPTDPGMVFRATPQGQITPLVYFTGRNGNFPNSLIEVENGTFYGTTARGGEHDQGTVFKLTLR
jgi:uncharacterized repeat protein (TIGR03803 family)